MLRLRWAFYFFWSNLNDLWMCSISFDKKRKHSQRTQFSISVSDPEIETEDKTASFDKGPWFSSHWANLVKNLDWNHSDDSLMSLSRVFDWPVTSVNAFNLIMITWLPSNYPVISVHVPSLAVLNGDLRSGIACKWRSITWVQDN